MFTTNTIQRPATIQYQTTSIAGSAGGGQQARTGAQIIKGVTKMEAQKATGQQGQQQQQQEFPTFCYTNGTNTVNLAQLATTDDNKTCYITQPFGYNYALVNQFQNGIAGIATVDGRIVVQNKPIANTVSSISFKCDVCGAMFTQLGHLNQHKRLHGQEISSGGGAAGDGVVQATTSVGSVAGDTITVVTSGGQSFLQGQNIISETGQTLGQIQIVSADQMEQHQQQHQDVTIVPNPLHHQNQQQQITITAPATVLQTSKATKGPKCSQCGGPRRKGSKGGRCETCVKNEQRATQIFVSPDGDVKFEITDMDADNVEEVATTDSIMDLDSEAGSPAPLGKSFNIVKKRESTVVSKCNRCNGTGLIYVEGTGAAASCEASDGHSSNLVTGGAAGAAGGAVGVGVAITPKKEKPSAVNTITVDLESPTDAGAKSDKPFYCNICGGQFSRYSSLWSHRKLHTGEKNHKCHVCGLAFAKSVYLKNHMRIHTGEKPYRCNTCGMQFSQSPHLKNHERTHSGEKPYVCEVCDKGFARHATLWNHRRIHTGEKPYKCDICGSAFSQAAHLKNHAKVHSGEKPFKCDICSTAFADRFALKRHRGIHDKYGQTVPRNIASVAKEEIIIEEEEEDDDEEDDDVLISNM